MRVLLDTHVLIWAIGRSTRLDAKTMDMLGDPENDVLFSAASIWEIAIKFARRRTDFTVRPEVILQAALQIGFTELPVHSSVASRVADLPHIHRDPFDRLLVAQAIAEPAVLFTADARLSAYSELVRRVGTG